MIRPEAENIVRTELVYRSGPLEEILLPYYLFYVRIPNVNEMSQALGLQEFGVYYVPAIEGKYIKYGD